jgi:FkbM family methyltransferase
MSFVSFAQNYEDVMLWRALKNIQNGFYIDVGAWSPDIDSVTRAFYDRGWRGINIEPNPERIAELRTRRERDVNLGVAASDNDGTIILYVVADTGLTTTDAALAQQHRDAGWDVSMIEVPSRNISGVLDDCVEPGQPIHFLKIDVEGHEGAVVRGIDFSRYRPWVILIEATAPGSQIEAYAEWEPVILAAGYRSVYWDGLNRFYLAHEHADLASSFTAPPNVFDQFVRSSEAEAFACKQDLERQALDLKMQLEAEIQRNVLGAKHTAGLEHQLHDLRAQLDNENQRAILAETIARHAQAEKHYLTHRSLWETLLFRASGKPKRAVRRLLFHKSGKPRGMLKTLVLHPDGRPHKPFRLWMSSPAYQSLPAAVRLPSSVSTAFSDARANPNSVLSPEAQRMERRISRFRSVSAK